jgi:hypothetical protein
VHIKGNDLNATYPSYKDLDAFIDLQRLRSLDIYVRERLIRRLQTAKDLAFCLMDATPTCRAPAWFTLRGLIARRITTISIGRHFGTLARRPKSSRN